MATYTPMQLMEMEYLVNRQKAIRRQLKTATGADREKLNNELNNIKTELNEVANAEARFNEYIRLGNYYASKAEEVHNKYCNA